MDVKQALAHQDMQTVKYKVSMIVGRDIDRYNEKGLSRATVETVAENLVDGVIAPLFFAAIGGAPLALAYKMTNTLDSMVGYKSEIYNLFGRASARIDDVLNYIPARLSIPTIALAAQILSGSGQRSLTTAVCEGGKSLLPAGVVAVRGRFGIGDPVACVDGHGNEVARGLAAYASGEVERILGLETRKVAKVLGYSNGNAVVHRDDLVLLEPSAEPAR